MLAWIRGKYDGGAVPFRFFLVPDRVISDTYGVWVYDADAGFVRGYEPSLDFSFHGWRHGVMVIQHKDGTLFSALTGLAFDGPRKGTALKPLATIETDWGYWLKAYPKTVAYHMFDKYVPEELPRSVNTDSVSTRLPVDKRLDADEPVIGIANGNSAKAYSLSLLANDHVIRDKVGDEEVVVLWYPPTRTAAIYAPRMESEKIPDRLRIEGNAQIPTAPFMDHETFSHWTIEGRAVEGPLKDQTLAWLPGVMCRWFAWAAEYPQTEIYAPDKNGTQASEPLVARLIEGERLDWDQLVKTAGYVVKKDPARKTITVFSENDMKEHELLLTPQTEFHVDGAWGAPADFAPGQSVYLIITTNQKKELVAVHAIADDISMQAMSRPFVLKEYDKGNGRIVFADEKERKAPMDLRVNATTRFLTTQQKAVTSGNLLYCNMSRAGSERVAMEVLDVATFEVRRNSRLQKQRAELVTTGLSGTVIGLDQTKHQVTVMVRRADTWYARSLKPNDAVGLMETRNAESEARNGPSITSARVTDVHPDYSRVRIRFDFADAALPEVKPGDEVALFATLPDKIDFDTPPDLGRFTARQDRIDYLLSTIFCPCGMLGTSCAGHWNTLAACKLHGCGMPNLVSKVIGERIDAGQTDATILAELVRKNGRNVLKPHQN
jgi:hypothetical protein